MKLEHFIHLLGIGMAGWGVMNLAQGQTVLSIVNFVTAAVAFGVGYLLQRRRGG